MTQERRTTKTSSLFVDFVIIFDSKKCTDALSYLSLKSKHTFATVKLHFYFVPVIFITTRKVSKYGVISGPYFPIFGLNTEIYEINRETKF